VALRLHSFRNQYETGKPLDVVGYKAAHLDVHWDMKTALPFFVPQAGNVCDATQKVMQGCRFANIIGSHSGSFSAPPDRTKKKLGAIRLF
jgi:hypothetical protein